jgi:hypothetical protein
MDFKKWLGLGFSALLVIGGCAFLGKERYVKIHSVAVQVSEERPLSIWVQITGGTGDPRCGVKLLPPQQERKGNTVRITVRAQEPLSWKCTLALVPFEITVPLKGRFAPGIYRVIVSSTANFLEKEFEVTQ